MIGGHSPSFYLVGFLTRKRLDKTVILKQAYKRKKKNLGYLILFMREKKSILRHLFDYCLLSLKPTYLELFFKVLMSLNTETKHTGLEVLHYTIVIKAIGEKMTYPVILLFTINN